MQIRFGNAQSVNASSHSGPFTIVRNSADEYYALMHAGLPSSHKVSYGFEVRPFTHQADGTYQVDGVDPEYSRFEVVA